MQGRSRLLLETLPASVQKVATLVNKVVSMSGGDVVGGLIEVVWCVWVRVT